MKPAVARWLVLALILLAIGVFAVFGPVRRLWDGPDLGQGWTYSDRLDWYGMSQGSRIYPLSWSKALKSEQGELVFSAAYGQKFGYLQPPAEIRFDGMAFPLGFVADAANKRGDAATCKTYPTFCELESKEPWIGLNCSACHTVDVSSGGRTIRIDGGATLADFDGYFRSVRAALSYTATNPAAFEAFAKAVLKEPSGDAKARLKRQVEEVVAVQAALAQKSERHAPYGFGRLDAQGHILNKVSMSVLMPGEVPVPEFPANAPASYPFIWDAPKQNYVQWNAIASNKYRVDLFGRPTDIGALGRNVGEVIGVFAHVDFRAEPGSFLGGYQTSVQAKSLIDLEQNLDRLLSPKWPEDLLGKLDPEKVEHGQELYKKYCQSCHAVAVRGSADRKPFEVHLAPIHKTLTDPMLACNTYLHKSTRGSFAARIAPPRQSDPRSCAPTCTSDYLVHAITKTIYAEKFQIADSVLEDLFAPLFPARRSVRTVFNLDRREVLPGVDDSIVAARVKECLQAAQDAPEINPNDEKTKHILVYKARPLNGIWATAPYLHNGSVPTLYDLFLKPKIEVVSSGFELARAGDAAGEEYRPESFYVGSSEFDAKKVGFRHDDQPGTFKFQVRTDAGVPIPGNYNSGHFGREYGSDLNEGDRWALVEYLKSL